VTVVLCCDIGIVYTKVENQYQRENTPTLFTIICRHTLLDVNV